MRYCLTFVKKTLVIFAIIIALLALLFQVKLKLYKSMTVLTGSMRPSINPGDVIIDKRVNAKNINIGDVITYTDNSNAFITHRVSDIVKVYNRVSFKTKGDANESEDLNLVSENQIVGKMIFRIPLIGYISNFVVNNIGLIILLVLAALIGIVYEVKTILSELRNIKRDDESTKDGMEI